MIQTLIAAIENAEAIDPRHFDELSEAPRREVSDTDISNVIIDEREELRRAAEAYERRGHEDEARRLRSMAEIADRYVSPFGQTRQRFSRQEGADRS